MVAIEYGDKENTNLPKSIYRIFNFQNPGLRIKVENNLSNISVVEMLHMTLVPHPRVLDKHFISFSAIVLEQFYVFRGVK